MDYGIYKNARNASWQCLIDCKIVELPIKPVQIYAHFGIHCKQADKFAINMLEPACVLWGLNLHTAEEIAQVCNISMKAAKYRAERMKLLFNRNKFLSHPLERMVRSSYAE